MQNTTLTMNRQSDDTETSAQINSTFDLLKRGESEIQLDDKCKDLVLVLGNTGAGKSTFTQWIAGDNKNLTAREVTEGTGEFIIEDNNRISTSTIKSKTIFPELVIDTETKTAYYDCPGFNDTRSASYDIAATYFTKKVTDFAKSVKILFIVNYSSVRTGVDRRDFTNLLRHINDFVKDIEKFQNSISIVVTKVDNTYVNKGKLLVEDNTVVTTIANFFKEVKENLQESLKTANISIENKKFCHDAIKLIEILLVKEGDDYTNIGIFRRPDEPGRLSDIALLQYGKQRIKMIINAKLNFTTIVNTNFGYTISADSKNVIYDLVRIINKQVLSSLSNIEKEIKKCFLTKIQQTNDLYKIKNELNTELNIISKITEETKNLCKSTDFVQTIMNIIDSTNCDMMNLSSDEINLKKQHEYLKFFQQMNNKIELYTTPLEWNNPLQDSVKYVDNLKNWYNFLIDLYEALSTLTYNQFQIACELLHDKEEEINIENINAILDKLYKMPMLGPYDFRNKDINEKQLNDLNGVLTNITFKKTSIFLSDRLIIKGDYVKLSEIDLQNDSKRIIKSLEIYALNTVFIDTDLTQVGKQLHLTIIAPKWEVVGERKINLDGAAGELNQFVSNNEHGLPGLPGGNAGSFLGIGKNFINSEKLTITANGGKGGPGQDGKKGAKGDKGKTPGKDGIYDKFERKGFQRSHLIVTIIYNESDKYFEIYGKSGGRGGNGGNGGVAGLGGMGGDIKIINLGSSDVKMITSNHEGSSGLGGKGGEGGDGGNYGDTVLVPLQQKFFLSIPLQLRWGDIIETWPSDKIGPSGSRGCDNSHGQPERKAIENSYQFHSNAITDYKNYLIENLNNNFIKHTLRSFLQQLSDYN